MSRARFWTLTFLPITALAVGQELWAAFDHSAATMPWTQYITTYVPWPVTAVGIAVLCGWLPYHFWHAYRRRIFAAQARAHQQGIEWGRRMEGPDHREACNLANAGAAKRPGSPAGCCGDPSNLDGNAHPWVLVTDNGPGDVYRCPECGAIDVD